MTGSVKFCLAILTLTAATASVICAQAVPASSMSPSVGPSLPSIDGVFNYALNGSELFETGESGSGVGTSTAISGDAAYSSGNVARPFSMVYAGGLLLGNQYGNSVTTFQDFAISQGLVKGLWSFGISDSVSYLPQSPTTGLSGIPGVGDLGSQPVQGPSSGPAGGLLTNNSTNISNSLSGNVERRLSTLTSISGTGSWSILRFPDNNGSGGTQNSGLDNTQYSGEVGLNHRLDSRDTITGGVVYSTFSYGSGVNLTVQTRGLNVAFQRVLSRKLSLSASAGPQWITSSNSALIPSNLTVATNISLLYAGRSMNGSISYIRGANGGSGVQPGALSDNVSASIGRSYGRDWVASATANYTHTAALLQASALVGAPGLGSSLAYGGGSGDTIFGGAQLTRRLTQSLSAFGSYNLQHQSTSGSLILQNAFSGFIQTFALGVSFSPRSVHLGQF